MYRGRSFSPLLILPSFVSIGFDSTKVEAPQTEVFVEGGLLASEPDHWINIPSPYGETSLIKTGIDLRKERSMTMEEFKKRFLDPKLTKKKKKFLKPEASSGEAQVYLDWLRDEKSKDDLAKSRPVRVLSQQDVDDEVDSADHDDDDERFIRLPKKYLQQPATTTATPEAESGRVRELQKPVFAKNPSEFKLKVDIPESERNPGAIYKMNNCFYDSNGDFLYKVPSGNK